MADLTFSTTLLGQFLEDMEAYAEVTSPSLSASYTYLEGAVTRSSQLPAEFNLPRVPGVTCKLLPPWEFGLTTCAHSSLCRSAKFKSLGFTAPYTAQ